MREDALTARLAAVRRRARVVTLAVGLCITWLAVVTTCALTLLIDRAAGLSEMGRLAALAACLVAAAMGLALGVLRAFLRPLSDDEAALLIEGSFPGGLRSVLISAVQLTRAPPAEDGTSAALIVATLRQALETLARVEVGRAVPTRRLRHFATAAAAALVLAASFAALRWELVAAWALRLVQPFNREAAYPTRTRLVPISGHLAVPAGEDAVVAVLAEGRVPPAGQLAWRRADGEAGTLVVRPDTHDRHLFRLVLGPVAADTWYFFEIGDAVSPRFLITALPRPELTGLVITKRLPPYVRLPDPEPQTLRDVEALEGTVIELAGETTVPTGGAHLVSAPAARRPGLGIAPARRVQRATLVLASGEEQPMRVHPDGSGRISGSFVVRQDDSYRIDLAYDELRPGGEGAITVVNDSPLWYRVRRLPDRPPVIEVVEPDRSATASPAGQVALRVRISDDYGVEGAHLRYVVVRAVAMDEVEARPPSAGEGEEAEGTGNGTGHPGIEVPGPVFGVLATDFRGVRRTAYSAEPREFRDPPGASRAAPLGEPLQGALDRARFTAVPLAGRFGSRRVAIDHDWLIQTTGARAGDRIVYYLTAADGRQGPSPPPTGNGTRSGDSMPGEPSPSFPLPLGDEGRDTRPTSPDWGPNVTETEWREIAVVSLAEIERQLRETREAIRAEVYRIYRRQRDLRARVDDLRTGAARAGVGFRGAGAGNPESGSFSPNPGPRNSTPAPGVSTPLDPQDLAAGEREQQRIAGLTASAAQRVLDLLKTMRANRAADRQTIARWEDALRDLTALGQQNMMRVITALSGARRGPEGEVPDYLRTASLEQREILSRLQALLGRIDRHLAFGRIVETLEGLIQDQDRAREETAEVARQVLGKPPGTLSPDERQRLADLHQEQEALHQTYEGLTVAVGRLLAHHDRQAEEEETGEPPSPEPDEAMQRWSPLSAERAAAAARVAAQIQTDRADRDLRQAAAALASHQALEAATAQTRALEKLRRLRDLLRQDDPSHLQGLERAAAQLEDLLRRQREVKRQTGQLDPGAAEERRRDLIRRQSEVAGATAELAAATREVSAETAEALDRARDHQQEALARMAAHQTPAAVLDQQSAVSALEEARAALDRERLAATRRLAEPGPVERLERAVQDLEQGLVSQERARQEALRMAAQADQGRPPDRQEFNRAEAQQRDLARATGDLQRRLWRDGAADVTRTLNAALKAQEAAADHLRGERPGEAARDQQRAIDELTQAGGDLRYQLKLARQAQERAASVAVVQDAQQRAIDALTQGARHLRDLDQLLGEQVALKAQGRDLHRRLSHSEKPIPRSEAVAVARDLALSQRRLQDQTAGLGDLVGDLDRDVARSLDEAGGPQGRAAEQLRRTDPAAADPEQAQAVEHLQRARGQLAGKFSEIVELLKRLEARRRETAGGEPSEGVPPAAEGQPAATIDDLLKLAGALVDIDRLRAKQDETKAATAAEAQKAATPEEAAVARLARDQAAHAAEAGELVGRMERWDPADDLGTASARGSLRQGGATMRDAAGNLALRQVAPAVAAQNKALGQLDAALHAAQEAFARAAQQARQELTQAQQQATDPTDYDPLDRPPGDVWLEDTFAQARWNVALPPRIRDEIIAALSDRFPAGYEELLRRYYADLSQEAWKQLDLRRP